MSYKKKVLILPGSGFDIFSQFLPIILPKEKYEVTVLKFFPPSGKKKLDFLWHVGKESEGFKDLVVNTNRVSECSNLLVSDISILGVGSDWNNPSKDNFFKYSWSGNDFIDTVRRNCKFLLFLDACRPDDNPNFWDYSVTPLKKNHDYALKKCDGIWSSYTHNDYPSNTKLWNYPVIFDTDEGIIPTDDAHTVRCKNRIIIEDGMKIISLFKADTIEQAHSAISDDIIDLVSNLNRSFDTGWTYHKRVSHKRIIGRSSHKYLEKDIERIYKKMDYFELPKDKIGFIHTWNRHIGLQLYAESYRFALDMVEEPYQKQASEFIARSTVHFAKCGVPVISRHYYYPSLLYPNLCITSNDEIIGIAERDDGFVEEINYAQSMIINHEVGSRKKENIKKAYDYFESFFSSVL